MLLCCLSLTLLRAQEGVRFESLTFEEALAESEGKKIGGFSWMPTLPGVVPVR